MSEEKIENEQEPETESNSGDVIEDKSEHEHSHGHSHRHRHKSKVKPFAYSVLAFFLAAALFLLSACMVLETTVYSRDFVLNIMRANGYYDMVKSELQSRLEDLVDASGFEKSFADSFVKNYDVQKAVEDYISAFYSGDNTLVDTTSFKQQLYTAIDVYVREKNIKVSDEAQTNIGYFVNEAADIYVAQISIPFFSTIANYIFKSKTVLNTVTISLAVFALILVAVIFFTNEFKHRRYRYLFIGSAGAALAVIILPTVVLLADKIRKINLTTRSIYNLFVNYFNTVFYNFYIWAGVLAVISVIMLVLYTRHYRHAIS